MPTKFVRIRDTSTSLETSVSEARAQQLADRGGVEILKNAPAVDGFGRPLPASSGTTKTVTKSKEQTR